MLGDQVARLAHHLLAEIDVSSTARKHARVTSLTMLRIRNRRACHLIMNEVQAPAL